jgi:hypothetical protein
MYEALFGKKSRAAVEVEIRGNPLQSQAQTGKLQHNNCQ